MPILTYCCEIWSSISKYVRSVLDIHGERLHTKFCKYVLCVNSKASNLACVGEVGQFPIFIDFRNDILKYYFYASQKIDDLIGQILKAGKNLYLFGVKSWYYTGRLRELSLAISFQWLCCCCLEKYFRAVDCMQLV